MLSRVVRVVNMDPSGSATLCGFSIIALICHIYDTHLRFLLIGFFVFKRLELGWGFYGAFLFFSFSFLFLFLASLAVGQLGVIFSSQLSITVYDKNAAGIWCL